MSLFNKSNKSIISYDLVEIEKKIKEKKPLTVEEMDKYKQMQSRELTNSILRVLGLCTLIFVIVCLGFGVVCLSFGTNTFNGMIGTVDTEGNTHTLYDGIYPFVGLFKQANALWSQMRGLETDALLFFQGTGLVLSGILLWIATILVAVWAVMTLVYAIRDLFKILNHFFRAAGLSLSGLASTAKETADAISKDSVLKQQKEENEVATATKKGKGKKKKLFDEHSDNTSITSANNKDAVITVQNYVPSEAPKAAETSKEEVKVTSMTSTIEDLPDEDLDKYLKGEITEEEAINIVKANQETKAETNPIKKLFDDNSAERRHE